MDTLLISLVVFFISVSISQSQSASGYNYTNRARISCYQCNIYSKGRPHDCEKEKDSPRTIKRDCFACMKSVAVTSLHDKQGGGDSRPGHKNRNFRKQSTSYSKYCITDDRFDRADGCHRSHAINGYTQQCFCRTHLCNHATVHTSIHAPILLVIWFISWISQAAF